MIQPPKYGGDRKFLDRSDKPGVFKMTVGHRDTTKDSTGRPSILITSGVHGSEQLAVVSSLRMVREYKKQKEDSRQYLDSTAHLKEIDPYFDVGPITLMAGVNPYGLIAGTREFKDEPAAETGTPDKDKANLNRAFRAEDRSDRYTFEYAVEAIKAEIDFADIVIDVHNSPLIHNCVLIDNGPYARNYVEFCREFGLDFVIREGPADTIKAYAIGQGKVGLTVELAGMGECPYQDLIVAEQTDFIKKVVTATMSVYGPNAIGSHWKDSEKEEFYRHNFPFSGFMTKRQPFPPSCLAQEIVYRGKFGFVEYNANTANPNGLAVGAGGEIGTVHCIDGVDRKIAMSIDGMVVDFKDYANVAENGKHLFTVQPVKSVFEELKNG